MNKSGNICRLRYKRDRDIDESEKETYEQTDLLQEAKITVDAQDRQ